MITTDRKTLGGLTLVVAFAAIAESAPARSAAALPAPPGSVVNVSTEAQLQNAVAQLQSNTTILVAPGIYTLTRTLYINGTLTNVARRGSSGNANDVMLQGPGDF